MKIYRFIPNTRRYRRVARSLVGNKWWPDGINLGRVADKLFPKVLPDAPSVAWPYEGNQFDGIPDELPFSDFPALTLNVPILSERAARSLVALGTVDVRASMTVDGERFLVVQPQPAPGALQAARSIGTATPDGEVLFYYARCFDTSRIHAEFFTIDELSPFSDLYVTDRLVTAATEAGLTGLEYIELVFDEEGPVVPVYPSVPRDQIHSHFGRGRMEAEILAWRCEVLGYADSYVEEVCVEAFSSGRLSFKDQVPTYTRVRADSAS